MLFGFYENRLSCNFCVYPRGFLVFGETPRITKLTGLRAWGELAYLKPLTEKQMEDYELRPAPGNPDRAARPSITAQLKEAARRPELPKEPDKTKHNKSHEDR